MSGPVSSAAAVDVVSHRETPDGPQRPSGRAGDPLEGDSRPPYATVDARSAPDGMPGTSGGPEAAVADAIAAAVARLRREAADARGRQSRARVLGHDFRTAEYGVEARTFDRAADLIAARGDIALEPEQAGRRPAETINTGDLL